ncbi:MAG: UDP-N-acetylmuramate--L-alanine ligase, partial [Anaerolineae bacterium]|nr:UDP-N-acetylmuramate--L-alanine ligase [Anaerolineae bacterium]
MPNVHLIGIGGAGLSAIATVLLQQGYTISGSDMQASAATERLAGLGARINVGHRPENLPNRVDTVVISSAIPADNPELIAAQKRGLAISKRAAWLGQMMQGKVGIAIAGSHGKTTTAAMTAWVLQALDQQPTFIVGGFIPQLGTNAAAGAGSTFVIEADEYDYTFLGLRPTMAVVTMVEWDHPDIFPTPASVQQAFVDFVRLVPAEGLVIGCGDDPGASTVLTRAKAEAVTYGFQTTNAWQAIDLQPNPRGGYDFAVHYRGETVAQVSLRIPGRHNVLNALAVLIIAEQQGLDLADVAKVLGDFAGVGRRFELKGEVNGITVVDDYAHHPTEITATLAAARSRFGDRPVWAVVQPHTFSRTQALFDAFTTAFDQADRVIVVDIFASREKDEGLVSSRDLAARMAHPNASYIGPLPAAGDYLVDHLQPGDVLLTLGAGDGYKIGEWVLERLGEDRDN